MVRETIAADQAEIHRDDGRARTTASRSAIASRRRSGAVRRKRRCRRGAARRSAAGRPAPSAAQAKPDAADAEQSAGRSAGGRRRAAARRAAPAGLLQSTNSAPMNGPSYYAKRIDATIAALKSAGVPVFWVGLPSIRGPKSTSDMQYLNDLYRAPRREGRHHLHRRLGRLRRRQRPLHRSGSRLRGPDPPAARRRRRALHQGRRAQARALCRARNPPRDGAGRRAGRAALPSEPQVPAAPAKAERPAAAPARRSGGSADRVGDRRPGTAGRARRRRPASMPRAGDPRAGRRARRSRRRPGAATISRWPRRGIAPFGTDPTVAATTDPTPAPTAAVASTPAPAVATATAPTKPQQVRHRQEDLGRAQQPQTSNRAAGAATPP